MTNEVQNPQTAEPQKEDQELQFIFKISEIDLILKALDELPHKMSRRIIDVIFEQARPQLPQQVNNNQQ